MTEPPDSRFTVLEQIGGGNYGSLYRVIDGESATLADRIIATKKLKEAINHPHVLREVSVQRQAQQCSRHVATLFHVVPRDHVRAALVLEYVPLDLRSFLNTFYCEQEAAATSRAAPWTPPCFVPLAYVRRVLRGLVEALHCLHARGIAHRDVKPENILVEPLGLDHPLRCVCPSADPSSSADGEASCWVHAARDGGHGQAECTGASSPPLDRHYALESRRCFFGGLVALHHELTGEELASAIHCLHCGMCRHLACRKRADASAVPTAGRTCAQVAGDALDGEGGATREMNAGVGASPLLTPDVKLCDFGSARHIGTLRLRRAEEQREELTPGPTTPVYCAPEMMMLQRYGTAVDMWAVGAILFEMVTGEFLLGVGTLRSFSGDVVVQDDYCVMHRLNQMFRHLGTPSVAEWRRIAHPLYYPDEMLGHLPQVHGAALFRSLANPALHDGGCTNGCGNGAEERTSGGAAEEGSGSTGSALMSPADVLHCHLGSAGIDLLRALLCYDPEKRMTAAEALRHPFLREPEAEGDACAASTAQVTASCA